MTRQELQSALQKPYRQAEWLHLLRNVLPGTEVFSAPQVLAVGASDTAEAVQLARVRLADRKQLAVLEVRVGDRIDLLRNRVGLRNLVARFIDQAE